MYNALLANFDRQLLLGNNDCMRSSRATENTMDASGLHFNYRIFVIGQFRYIKILTRLRGLGE